MKSVLNVKEACHERLCHYRLRAAESSTALVLGRSCRTVTLIDDHSPRNAVTRASHGFLIRDGIEAGAAVNADLSEELFAWLKAAPPPAGRNERQPEASRMPASGWRVVYRRSANSLITFLAFAANSTEAS